MSARALGTQLILFTSRTGSVDHPKRRGLTRAASAVCAGVVVTSCAAGPNGIQRESGPAILKAAAAALGSAETFEIEAASRTKGKQASITFKIGGKDVGEGTFTSAAVSFDAKEVHGVDYFRSKTVWDQVGGAGLQSALGDRWVYISASSPTAALLTGVFASLTSPRLLAKQLTKSAQSAVRGKAGRFAGQPVIGVIEPSAGTIFVATTGKPYPLHWDNGSAGTIDFRDFGARFSIKAPKRALNLAAILAG